MSKAYLTMGDGGKTEAGEGRTIPLNSDLLEAMVEYLKWYTKRRVRATRIVLWDDESRWQQ